MLCNFLRHPLRGRSIPGSLFARKTAPWAPFMLLAVLLSSPVFGAWKPSSSLYTVNSTFLDGHPSTYFLPVSDFQAYTNWAYLYFSSPVLTETDPIFSAASTQWCASFFVSNLTAYTIHQIHQESEPYVGTSADSLTILGGNAGPATMVSIPGGTGGVVSIYAGQGGMADFDGLYGGPGGDVYIGGGTGGYGGRSVSSHAGGTGGDLYLYGGTGGGSFATNAGDGGNVYISAGPAGGGAAGTTSSVGVIHLSAIGTGGEIMFSVAESGSLDTSMKISPSMVVINEEGADRDFRIEATSETNAFFIDGANGNVGLGSATPQARIEAIGLHATLPISSWYDSANWGLVVADDQVQTAFGGFYAGDSPTQRPLIYQKRARGSLAAPSVVVPGDYLGSIIVSGYDSSSFQNPASINFVVDAAVSEGAVPVSITFATGTAYPRTVRMTVASDGSVDFHGNVVSNAIFYGDSANLTNPPPSWTARPTKSIGGYAQDWSILNDSRVSGVTASGIDYLNFPTTTGGMVDGTVIAGNDVSITNVLIIVKAGNPDNIAVVGATKPRGGSWSYTTNFLAVTTSWKTNMLIVTNSFTAGYSDDFYSWGIGVSPSAGSVHVRTFQPRGQW